MARQRLSWDAEKVAEIEKKADPYTINQERQNPPVEKYQTGDPSAWAEDPHMDTPWKTEGRNEVGLPAPAREAVVAARKLEDKAFKCITIAQRMLPGSEDSMIEEQATDLMFLPERAILATLQRQTSLAEKIAGDDDDDDDDDDDGCKEAGNKPEAEKDEPAENDEKEPSGEAPAGDDPKPVEAGKEPKKDPPAAPAEEPAAPAAPAAPADEEAGMELGKQGGDLLDQLFQDEPVVKTGAKKLSGIVKQASNGDGALGNLWEIPPDISKTFGRK